MCRLLGKIGNLKIADQAQLIEHFQNLSDTGRVPKGDPQGHHDGWGIVFYKHGKVTLYRKKPTDACKDSDFRKLKKELVEKTPDLFIGHLRKASIGSRTLTNTQPYLISNFSFAHNGTVFGAKKIKLNDGFVQLRKGNTDSERLFLLIAQNINGKHENGVVEAIKKAVESVRGNLDYTAMNMILTNGEKMWALREINEKNEEVMKLKLEKYYELYIGKNKEKSGAVFFSEKISKILNWRLIRNHEIIEVEFIKGKVNTRSIKI